MKTPAIKQAFLLKEHPEEMAWLCLPSSEYPEGLTDLLRLCASDTRLEEFATEYQLDAQEVHEILINFINKVVLLEGNSDLKLLATDSLSTTELRKLHYQLLMRIYHPDVNASPDAKKYSSIITNAYQRLKNTHSVIEIKTSRNSINTRKPPSSFYHATRKAELNISNTRNAIAALSAISVLALVAFAGHLYDPAKPELTLSKTKNETTVMPLQVAKTSPSKLSTSKFTKASLSQSNDNASTQGQLQSLLHNLEQAYEQGNVDLIKDILANAPEIKNQTDKQISDKLVTLFEITSDRKMLLYSFDWRNISGKMQGKGKFISRYQLTGEDQWLTREGSAYITAQQSDKELKVIKLELENHSNEY